MNTRNFSKATEAVSPVVATLLLVLVAAGAAIGFGVFLNGFQKNTQSHVSGEAPSQILKIGGSSTVFELTEKALPAWKAAHPSIQIDDQEGGSTAGKVAICKGLVDIGAESSPFATSGPQPSLTTCPDFNGDGIKDAGEGIQVFTVGYDGVAMAFKSGSCTIGAANNGISPNGFTQAQARELYNVNGGALHTAATGVSSSQAAGTGTLALVSGSANAVGTGTSFSTSDVGRVILDATTNGNIAAGTVISVVTDATHITLSQNAAGTGATDAYSLMTKTLTAAAGTFVSSDAGRVIVGNGIPASATIASVGSDGSSAVLSAYPTAVISSAAVTLHGVGLIPTGTVVSGVATQYLWDDLVTGSVCSATTQTGKVVVLGSRSDPSGTEDGFCKRVLNYEKDGTHCTADNYDQMSDSFYTKVNPQPGNDGIATWLNAGADRLSFIGFGFVSAAGSGLSATPLGYDSAHLIAPSASTIKAAGADSGLKNCDSTVTPTTEYCATRALQYMTAGTPSATEQLFLDFMTQTLNNENFNAAAGYVSLY